MFSTRQEAIEHVKNKGYLILMELSKGSIYNGFIVIDRLMKKHIVLFREENRSMFESKEEAMKYINRKGYIITSIEEKTGGNYGEIHVFDRMMNNGIILYKEKPAEEEGEDGEVSEW